MSLTCSLSVFHFLIFSQLNNCPQMLNKPFNTMVVEEVVLLMLNATLHHIAFGSSQHVFGTKHPAKTHMEKSVFQASQSQKAYLVRDSPSLWFTQWHNFLTDHLQIWSIQCAEWKGPVLIPCCIFPFFHSIRSPTRVLGLRSGQSEVCPYCISHSGSRVSSMMLCDWLGRKKRETERKGGGRCWWRGAQSRLWILWWENWLFNSRESVCVCSVWTSVFICLCLALRRLIIYLSLSIHCLWGIFIVMILPLTL